MKPRTGAIVVTYNSEDHISECLTSLRAELREMDAKIVVVDNRSTDGTRAFLSKHLASGDDRHTLTILNNNENVGFGAAVNQAEEAILSLSKEADSEGLHPSTGSGWQNKCRSGWQNSGSGRRKSSTNCAPQEIIGDCDFFLIVNPDVSIGEGAVREMVSYMIEHPKCGLVGPVIENSNGARIPSHFAFTAFGEEIVKLCGFAKLIPPSVKRLIGRIGGRFMGRTLGTYFSGYGESSNPKTVDWLSGACMLVRKDALGSGPIFDERFFLYYEDQDLCRRISDGGYSVDLLPSARVMHSCHGSTGGAPSAFCINNDRRSMFLYFEKHGEKRTVLLLGLAGLLISVATILITPAAVVFRWRATRLRERISTCKYLMSASLVVLDTLSDVSEFNEAFQGRRDSPNHPTDNRDGGVEHDRAA